MAPWWPNLLIRKVLRRPESDLAVCIGSFDLPLLKHLPLWVGTPSPIHELDHLAVLNLCRCTLVEWLEIHCCLLADVGLGLGCVAASAI